MNQALFSLKKRYRRIAFTLNNWQTQFESKDAVKKHLLTFNFIQAFVLGFEIGEEKKTPHIQGFLKLKRAISGIKLKTIFKNAHFEKVLDEATYIEYCQKENDDNIIKYGNFDKRKTTTKEKSLTMDEVIDLIENESLDKRTFFQQYPKLYVKYHRQIVIYFAKKLEENARKIRDIQIFFISGKTNIGKSFFLNTCFKNIASINCDSQYPWDDYFGEEVLVFEEYEAQFSLPHLLKLTDKYFLPLHARYHNRYPNYKLIFFTSNLSFDEAMQLKKTEEENPTGINRFNYHSFKNQAKKKAQQDALLRRFTGIYENIESRDEMKQVITTIINKLNDKSLLNDKGQAFLKIHQERQVLSKNELPFIP